MFSKELELEEMETDNLALGTDCTRYGSQVKVPQYLV